MICGEWGWCFDDGYKGFENWKVVFLLSVNSSSLEYKKIPRVKVLKKF